MRILIAMEDGLLLAQRSGDAVHSRFALEGRATQSLASDPGKPSRVYCGTFDAGVWISDDGGQRWEQARDLAHRQVTAVAVSPNERSNGVGVVYAGTEPSAVFRSEDGGTTWKECVGLTDLPSSKRWSFPPRPHTHHVRWITPDPTVAGRLYVAIEAGALVHSEDGGATWLDRTPDGPYDTHSLIATAREPACLHSAAGDGYFESGDGGATWTQPEQGLNHRYLWSVAVDPHHRRTVIVSSASGPFTAHWAANAESYLYRRVDGESWERISRGLPEANGTTVSALARDPSRAGVFYAVNNHGVYESQDAGESWAPLELEWLGRFRGQRATAALVFDTSA